MSLCSAPDVAVLASNQGARLQSAALKHRCAAHPFFSYLQDCHLNRAQVAALLKNYDAHASVLRRLLLKAATIMPDEAVGYILENVRNEYGNGSVENRHQLQLKDLASRAGVSDKEWASVSIESGVRSFIKKATSLYYPLKHKGASSYYKPAIAAGAITATEILALEEFRAMLKPFSKLGLADHVWFDHLLVEQEHTQESLDLASYFSKDSKALAAVRYGFESMLAATVDLYDGLLSALLAAEHS